MQLDKAFSLGQTDHLLTYGTTLKREEVTGLRTGQGICLQVLSASCTSVGAISTNASDTLTPQSDFPDPTIKTYSLFAQDEIRWGQWTFLPGLRYDYTRMRPELTDEFLATVTSSGVTDYSDDEKPGTASRRSSASPMPSTIITPGSASMPRVSAPLRPRHCTGVSRTSPAATSSSLIRTWNQRRVAAWRQACAASSRAAVST